MFYEGVIESDKVLEELGGVKPVRTSDEIIEKSKLFFSEADQNGDDELDLAESEVFFKNYMEYEVTNQTIVQFNKRDRNGDGVLDEKDIPTKEESLKELEALNEKLDLLKESFSEENLDKSIKEFIEKNAVLVMEEDFYKANKNKDDCVDKDEYVAFCIDEGKRSREESLKEINSDDGMMPYRSKFNEMNVNSDGCVDRDEYLANEKKESRELCEKYLDLCMDEDEIMIEVENERFNEIDENKDDCVDIDEYVSNEKKSLEDIYNNFSQSVETTCAEIYDKIEKKVDNCLSKDEYIKYVQ
jgi:hypothetical protein